MSVRALIKQTLHGFCILKCFHAINRHGSFGFCGDFACILLASYLRQIDSSSVVAPTQRDRASNDMMLRQCVVSESLSQTRSNGYTATKKHSFITKVGTFCFRGRHNKIRTTTSASGESVKPRERSASIFLSRLDIFSCYGRPACRFLED